MNFNPFLKGQTTQHNIFNHFSHQCNNKRRRYLDIMEETRVDVPEGFDFETYINNYEGMYVQ